MAKPFRALTLAVSILAPLTPIGGASAAETAAPTAPPDAAPAAVASGKAFAYLTDGRKVALFDASSATVSVARIGPENVAMSELTDALSAIHAEQSGDAKAGKVDPRTILDRIIDLRLVAQEARAMGMADLPEIKAALEAYGDGVLRNVLRARVVKGLKPDSKAVERAYRDAVREWKIASVAFEREQDAKALVARARAGEPLEALAKKAIADKKAPEGNAEAQYVPESKLSKPVLAVVRSLPAGKISEPIRLAKRFIVLRQDGARYPEDPDKRALAAEAAAAPVREKALRTYYAGLLKKYASVDRKIVASLDFNAAKPGLAALVKDQRVIARIEGEKPVTVAALADALSRGLFHANDRAQSKQIMNEKKKQVLEDLMQRRLFAKEARAQRLFETEAYRSAMAQREAELLVGSYVEKVLVPTVTVTDDEARRDYEAHKGEYTSPPLVKIEGTAFESEAAARDAQKKARSGTDFRWLVANLPGQVPEDKRSLEIASAQVVALDSIVDGLAKELKDAKAGDFRVYAASAKEHYVVRVLEVYPPQTQKFEQVKGTIQGKLSGQKLDQAFKEVAGKLRQAQKVEVLLARIEM